MPITSLQKHIFTLIRESRHPDSYIAGGTAINRSAESLRYSADIDIFHDSDEAVTTGFTADVAILKKNRFKVTVLISQPSFYRVLIAKGQDQLKLEWARDSAFRFYPVIEDEICGYRLHDADLAVNKCLALANRVEVRDTIDMLQLNKSTLSLAACCWAGCGKDPGFTPDLMISQIKRNSIFTPNVLAAESLSVKLDPVQFKQELQSLIKKAEELLRKLPASDLGCLYIGKNGEAIKTPQLRKINEYEKHFGSVRGCWPKVLSAAHKS